MHDPHTLAHQIKSPFKKNDYRNALISIWHKDPCTDGTDDSCGWFMRQRHGDKQVLEAIIKRFEFDWDSQFNPEGSDRVYFNGLFYPEDAGAGMPNMGVTAIGLNLFWIAAYEFFGKDRDKANRFMRKNLWDIMFFVENPFDSLRDSIVRKWGTDTKRDERIREMAGCVYGWILRQSHPWWKHPRWHIHHWRIQVNFIHDIMAKWRTR